MMSGPVRLRTEPSATGIVSASATTRLRFPRRTGDTKPSSSGVCTGISNWYSPPSSPSTTPSTRSSVKPRPAASIFCATAASPTASASSRPYLDTMMTLFMPELMAASAYSESFSFGAFIAIHASAPPRAALIPSSDDVSFSSNSRLSKTPLYLAFLVKNNFFSFSMSGDTILIGFHFFCWCKSSSIKLSACCSSTSPVQTIFPTPSMSLILIWSDVCCCLNAAL
mmetsp:Transcript_23096/g.39591  ORF Transcript_23096/g.39591 Transcript_23096/m.39591 type:complete len:225 (-) Transcript_23096:155-829(-)